MQADACAIRFDVTSARDECLGKLLATERYAGTPVPLGLAAELVGRSTGKPAAVADMHTLFRLPPGAQNVSMESVVTMVKMDVIRLAFADGNRPKPAMPLSKLFNAPVAVQMQDGHVEVVDTCAQRDGETPPAATLRFERSPGTAYFVVTPAAAVTDAAAVGIAAALKKYVEWRTKDFIDSRIIQKLGLHGVVSME